MKLCVLTYDTPHLKTAQVLAGLAKNGFSGIDLMLMPFVQRPERSVLFKHRPDQFVGAHVRELAAKHNCQVLKYDEWRDHLHRYDAFMVCGSNLIEPEFARTGKILNVHAGLIPMVRGLDSFKWAILKGYPLGNTLHRIDERADAG
jgi:phosphoribosylglycinamide formyltransferase 1